MVFLQLSPMMTIVASTGVIRSIIDDCRCWRRPQKQSRHNQPGKGSAGPTSTLASIRAYTKTSVHFAQLVLFSLCQWPVLCFTGRGTGIVIGATVYHSVQTSSMKEFM